MMVGWSHSSVTIHNLDERVAPRDSSLPTLPTPVTSINTRSSYRLASPQGVHDELHGSSESTENHPLIEADMQSAIYFEFTSTE